MNENTEQELHVAQTLVDSNSGLEEVTTIRTLRDGVRRALQEGLTDESNRHRQLSKQRS